MRQCLDIPWRQGRGRREDDGGDAKTKEGVWKQCGLFVLNPNPLRSHPSSVSQIGSKGKGKRMEVLRSGTIPWPWQGARWVWSSKCYELSLFRSNGSAFSALQLRASFGAKLIEAQDPWRPQRLLQRLPLLQRCSCRWARWEISSVTDPGTAQNWVCFVARWEQSVGNLSRARIEAQLVIDDGSLRLFSLRGIEGIAGLSGSFGLSGSGGVGFE